MPRISTHTPDHTYAELLLKTSITHIRLSSALLRRILRATPTPLSLCRSNVVSLCRSYAASLRRSYIINQRRPQSFGLHSSRNLSTLILYSNRVPSPDLYLPVVSIADLRIPLVPTQEIGTDPNTETLMKYPNEKVMKAPGTLMKYPNEKVMKAPGTLMKYPNEKVMKDRKSVV